MTGSLPDPDDIDVRTDRQKEWAAWAAHGYRKLYQPRSMLWFGFLASTVLIGGLLTLLWLAFHGHLP